jgi:hypothetical protein
MNNPTIAYHVKIEIRGWHEVLRESADWPGWNQTDRNMIDHLICTGDTVVTLGWNMYEVVLNDT